MLGILSKMHVLGAELTQRTLKKSDNKIALFVEPNIRLG